MSTSYLCPHCQKVHVHGTPCKPEDLNRADASVTPVQRGVADVEETAAIMRYKARKNLPPEGAK